MTAHYGRVAERVYNTPLLYDERKAHAFLNGMGSRIAGGTIIVNSVAEPVEHKAFANGRPAMGRVGDRVGRAYQRAGFYPFAVIDNVALIPIEGTLVHKGGYVGQSSGTTSYEGLMAQIAAAYRAPDIKGVAFEVDSFGGEVSGAFETAQMIADLSKKKPTISILTDFAYSAGYLLASQARQIIAPKYGGAGSIGVIMLHADYSQQLSNEGIAVTIIRAGAVKAQGNPYEPLPPELADRWRVQAEEMRSDFADVVAKARRGRVTKASVLKTEADAYSAREALSLGLIDAIGDPAIAFDAFLKEVNRS